jgi:hemerythrin-like domain-containing protein
LTPVLSKNSGYNTPINADERRTMKPIGPLMREHRLIERMIKLLERQLQQIEAGQPADVAFLLSAVDFFRTYADRTHHGKEEDILFRDLAKKPLSDDLKRITQDLVQEHKAARAEVKKLAEAASSYGKGNLPALGSIKESLKTLVQFYPAHITKEDQHFFYPVQDYFTRTEQDAMLDEFQKFDRQLIHEKYLKVVEEEEKPS